MENEKQLQTIEEELKLLKGEFKQTVSTLRDYLLNMDTPSSEFSPILAALDDGDSTVNMKGTVQLTPGEKAQEEPKPKPESKPGAKEAEEETHDKKARSGGSHQKNSKEPHMSDDEEAAMSADEDLLPEDEEMELEEEPDMEEEIFEEEEPLMAGAELPFEDQPMDYGRLSSEINQSVPKVNLLANLISWISVARREIGDDQLATFLEVYGISGHLSPEMKDVILHLADITSERSGENNRAEIWSNSMLSLHGILTGGESPLNPMTPHWGGLDDEIEPFEDEITEMDESEKSPVKLKLVFPNGDGKGKEYCIDFTPEVDTGGSEN